MKKCLSRHGMIVVVLLSVGCSPSPRRTALHDFGILAPTAVQATQVPNKPSISVDAPTWLWDNRIRYRLLYDEPTRVRFYGLDLWVAAPPELLEQYWLNTMNTLSYPVVIRILAFEQQFDSPKQAKVVLRFSAEAYSADHQRRLGERLFNLAIPTKTADAAGAVAGFTVLLGQATDALQRWGATLK